MLLGNRKFGRNNTNCLWQVVLYVVTAIFVVQMLGTGYHHHDLTKVDDDCVSCVLAAHMPSGPPDVSIHVEPTVALLIYLVAVAPLYVFLGQPSYLIPLSQAPPRRVMP